MEEEMKPTKRIENIARPPFPYKVKTEWESTEFNYHNQKRALEMKRLQHQRQHANWSTYFYAPIDKKEAYKEELKKQIDQKKIDSKRELERELLVFRANAHQDASSITEDRQQRLEKYDLLSKYRDDNKQIMQDKWMSNYAKKKLEWEYESRLLKQDPFNWSKTLK